MHHHQLLILFALLIFAFGLVSRLAERYSVTGPMVFMTVGILGSSLAFGFLHVTPEMGPVKLVAELALTLVLFIDATLIDRSLFRGGSRRIPVRLLLIGLPLTMVLGTLAGVWMLKSSNSFTNERDSKNRSSIDPRSIGEGLPTRMKSVP